MSPRSWPLVGALDKTIYLFDVEPDHEKNRRQRKNCQHVEITEARRGPVVRGRGVRGQLLRRAGIGGLQTENRLRRSKDRRKIHYRQEFVSLHEAHRGRSRRRAFAQRASSAGTPVVATTIMSPADRAHQGASGHADDRRRRALRRWSSSDTISSCSTISESDRPSVVYRSARLRPHQLA